MNLESLRGHWCLVTGASSGIGAAYAAGLAERGMNCVLVARRQERLDALAARMEATHGVRCVVRAANLSVEGTVSSLRDELVRDDIHIRLLCNCAAFGRWGRVEDTDAPTYARMIRLNAAAVVEACLAFLPDLVSHPDSAIVNVSSQAAYQPVPYMSVYAATKAFVHAFSLALHEEWRERGLVVQTLVPGPTATEFDTLAGGYASKVIHRGDPPTVASASLQALAGNELIATSAARLWPQRLFYGLYPTRFVLRKVADMFRPPRGVD